VEKHRVIAILTTYPFLIFKCKIAAVLAFSDIMPSYIDSVGSKGVPDFRRNTVLF